MAAPRGPQVRTNAVVTDARTPMVLATGKRERIATRSMNIRCAHCLNHAAVQGTLAPRFVAFAFRIHSTRLEQAFETRVFIKID